MIVCNIHRFLQFLVIEVFYRAIEIINKELHYSPDVNDDQISISLISGFFNTSVTSYYCR
jgi:hypothetical protein